MRRGNQSGYKRCSGLIYYTAQQALHNKLRAVDSCTTKDTWGAGEVGLSVEEGDPLSFPIQGGAKIYVFEWEL